MSRLSEWIRPSSIASPYRNGLSVEPGDRHAFTMSTWPRRALSPKVTEPTYARASSVALSTTSKAADVRSGRSEKYRDTRSSSMRCRSPSSVERRRAVFGDSTRKRCASSAACTGGCSERATTGSIRASRTSAADHVPDDTLHALHGAAERGAVEVQREDLALRQVRFQLQRASHLPQLRPWRTRAPLRGRFQDARNLHRQRRSARHHAPV